MPVKFLLHPHTRVRLEFADAPRILEEAGIMPSYAVEAIIREFSDEKPAFNVRPSDVNPAFTCRRQRVWQSTHEYGVNPLDIEGMTEGSAFHAQLGAHEIVVPGPEFTQGNEEVRLNVCDVAMRGRIDWLFENRIEDLKTSTPFWIAKFPSKEAKAKDPSLRPYAEIWVPKNEDDDVKKWQIQLSIYRILLEKSGRKAPGMGRVWRRYSGVKADKGRWKRFDFPLLSETELDLVAGEWMRGLRDGLSEAETVDPEAWRKVPADGKAFVGSRGNQWACDRCPLRRQCEDVEGWSGF